MASGRQVIPRPYPEAARVARNPLWTLQWTAAYRAPQARDRIPERGAAIAKAARTGPSGGSGASPDNPPGAWRVEKTNPGTQGGQIRRSVRDREPSKDGGRQRMGMPR